MLATRKFGRGLRSPLTLDFLISFGLGNAAIVLSKAAAASMVLAASLAESISVPGIQLFTKRVSASRRVSFHGSN
jgi:hypothetical protein